MCELSTEDIKELLGLQLCEVEMLTSMFPSAGEFVLDDPAAPVQIQEVVDGTLPYKELACRIGFSVKIDLAGNNKVDTEK